MTHRSLAELLVKPFAKGVDEADMKLLFHLVMAIY